MSEYNHYCFWLSLIALILALSNWLIIAGVGFYAYKQVVEIQDRSLAVIEQSEELVESASPEYLENRLERAVDKEMSRWREACSVTSEDLENADEKAHRATDKIREILDD